MDSTPIKNPKKPLEGVRLVCEGKQLGFNFSFPANKNLKDRAKKMAKNMTKAEQLVWFHILKSNKTGFKWIKQKVIDNYIVDFYCHTLSLVIEIDGDTHTKTKDYDQERVKLLNYIGLKVIRYANNQVYKSIDSVFEDIHNQIKIRQTELIKN